MAKRKNPDVRLIIKSDIYSCDLILSQSKALRLIKNIKKQMYIKMPDKGWCRSQQKRWLKISNANIELRRRRGHLQVSITKIQKQELNRTNSCRETRVGFSKKLK